MLNLAHVRVCERCLAIPIHDSVLSYFNMCHSMAKLILTGSLRFKLFITNNIACHLYEASHSLSKFIMDNGI